jgi:hypothetical protein
MYYTETINWFEHELTNTTLTQNKKTVCFVVTNKKISLFKHSLCVFSNNKNTLFTEVMFMVNMENNYDWLASNKTWKKCTRIGDRELLSYAGIDFQKPTDEELLVKEIKRRKKLNDMKLDNNRKQVAQKRASNILIICDKWKIIRSGKSLLT